MTVNSHWIKEPYRLFFPSGTLLLLCGLLVWVPQIWHDSSYPVSLHRYLMLNGFVACFVGGFLMTAVPKFSQTKPASNFDVAGYFLITLAGIIFIHFDLEKTAFLVSGLQPLFLLRFLFMRIGKRKMNPPYSFVFIFVGLLLWMGSAFYRAFIDPETMNRLHYEGAIAAIILGVGSRLIPGILGHTEIVSQQRMKYERPIALWKTVPLSFALVILVFVVSYFLLEDVGNWLRVLVVSVISLKYWQLYHAPKDKTALTWCIWISSWMIALSFLLRALWPEASIHISHSFFINGIVLLSFLIATRVLQSHGPKRKELENHKALFLVTLLTFSAAFTRVIAFAFPESYLSHLGYSAFLLTLATLIWSFTYLKYVRTFPAGVV
jgi:uncharacterized protein involved in response to NO